MIWFHRVPAGAEWRTGRGYVCRRCGMRVCFRGARPEHRWPWRNWRYHLHQLGAEIRR